MASREIRPRPYRKVSTYRYWLLIIVGDESCSCYELLGRVSIIVLVVIIVKSWSRIDVDVVIDDCW